MGRFKYNIYIWYPRPAKARRQTFHVTAAVTIDPSCTYIPLGEEVRGYATDAYEGYALLLGASGRGDQYARAARSVYSVPPPRSQEPLFRPVYDININFTYINIILNNNT